MPASLSIPILIVGMCASEKPSPGPAVAILLPAESSHAPAAGPFSDAERFFDELISRYRRLAAYEDCAEIHLTSTRPGEEPREFRVHLQCSVRNGFARVTSPASQIRRSFGLRRPQTLDAQPDNGLRSYDEWLAPHLSFLTESDPREKLNRAAASPLRAIDVEPIVIEDKQLLHLELRSGGDDRESFETNVDVYVNPESLLIERIEHDQRLSTGTCVRTTVEIRPTLAQDTEAPAGAAGTSTRDSTLPDDTSEEEKPTPTPQPRPIEPLAPVAPADGPRNAEKAPPRTSAH